MGSADDGERRREDAAGDLVGGSLPVAVERLKREEGEEHAAHDAKCDLPGRGVVVGGVFIDGGGCEALVWR